MDCMEYEVVFGDLLDQDVDVIVNSWNRNIIPWWLLVPQGVSGAIKKKGGNEPFKQVAKFGSIPLGQARMTAAGTLPFKAIIHVAGINMFWYATEYSVRESVRNAMHIVAEQGFSSVAFPLIGSGSGNRKEEWSLALMTSELQQLQMAKTVKVVRFLK